jgi:hypothetical protein
VSWGIPPLSPKQAETCRSEAVCPVFFLLPPEPDRSDLEMNSLPGGTNYHRGIDFFRSEQKCSNCSNSAMVCLVHNSGYSDRSHLADPGIIYLFSQK